MHFVKRIDLKKYFLIGTVLTAAIMPLMQNKLEMGIALLIFFATCVNHFFLVEIITDLTQSKAKEGYQLDKVKIAAMFSAKIIILVVALAIGVQVMGKRVMLPLLNYIIQIFVLAKSLNGAKD